jgi:hypothetical protein
MRYNKDSERGLTFDSVAVDLSNFPKLRSNAQVWDCQRGGWVSSVNFNQFATVCDNARNQLVVAA